MFKKHMLNSIIVIFFILLISSISFAQDTIVDTSNLDKGVISINYNENMKNMKVLIAKGYNQEHYDVKANTNYPLQFGSGLYNISILEHVDGDTYKFVHKEEVNLKIEDEKTVFLQPCIMANWNDDSLAIKKAKELTKGVEDDYEKVKLIYNYIINNIEYDYEKINTVQIGYVPNIDNTLNSQSGMCYDYASLTAAMLRSVNIPTKLLMGYNVDVEEYHAWNQIYLNEEWITIDTTYDAAYAQNQLDISMIKDANDYSIEKIY